MDLYVYVCDITLVYSSIESQAQTDSQEEVYATPCDLGPPPMSQPNLKDLQPSEGKSNIVVVKSSVFFDEHDHEVNLYTQRTKC